MPMSESTGPTGGYGVRPANPSGKVIVTSGTTKGSSRPPKMPQPPKPSKARRGRR